MNTNYRGKKRTDVVNTVAKIWNARLEESIKAKGYSQKTFAQAYKDKYGTGNQADVSRWVNVGTNSAKGEIIGFPSYDTMKRIANFFGVTVGYLTGETDYKTFEMERACEFFCIDETAGAAIERITKLKEADRLERYMKDNYGKALCRLLAAKNFEPFIGGICELAETMYFQQNPTNYFQSEKVKNIRPEIMELALKYREGDVGILSEVSAEVLDEVIDAMDILAEAESKNFSEESRLEQNVKVAKYELQERYLKLLEEVSSIENLADIMAHYYEPFSSVEELKKRIEATLNE